MNKINFSQSVKELSENFNFKERFFDSFSFGTVDECKAILRDSILSFDKTIKELIWCREYDEISVYLSNTKGKGLLLSGSVGRGKTNIIMFSIPLIFYHYQKKVIRTTHSNELHKKLESFQNYRLIAIDEIGTEPEINDFGTKYEPFNQFLDIAESNSKLTFLSTNLNGEQIRMRYGIRAIDRITRLCHIVKFEGESFRK
jgi:DNA replication protein DnaC